MAPALLLIAVLSQVSTVGGRPYRGTAPISVTGNVITCVPASGVAGGCLTAAQQNIGGTKVFLDGLTCDSTLNVRNFISTYSSQGLSIFADRTINDPGSDITVGNSRGRDAGTLFPVLNGADTSAVQLKVDYQGNVVLACGNAASSGGCTIIDNTGISGHVALKSYSGGYLVVLGQLPTNYVGVHGATVVGNLTGMDGGYLLEVQNNQYGTTTDKKLMVNWQGGVLQKGGYSRPQFSPCAVDLDGGQAADESTLMWATDLKQWFYCSNTGWVAL